MRLRGPHSGGLALANFLFAILAASAFQPVPAQEAYPTRPVSIIVPNATGGLADITARLVAARLGEALGQPVIVDNRPGKGGTVGTAAAARSAPDGYTLLAVFDSHATNLHLFRALGYNTRTDFTPISLLVRGPLVLVVNRDLPVRTTRELIGSARAKPGAMSFATVGPGSPARLLVELLKLDAGIDVASVSYRGAELALGELAGGEVDAMFVTLPSAKPYLNLGRVRAIAITSEQRSAVLPGVPALSETLPGFAAEAWVGLLAPARTSPEIIGRLNAEVVKVLARPEVKARFAAEGLETVGSTPAELDRWIRAAIDLWGQVIRQQKITL
jgi:tripartite-type tricarboxylate transporter receptor subunit TctC